MLDRIAMDWLSLMDRRSVDHDDVQLMAKYLVGLEETQPDDSGPTKHPRKISVLMTRSFSSEVKNYRPITGELPNSQYACFML